MRTEDFDYVLPDDLIAQEPWEPRDASRLMVLDRASRTWRHLRFYDLPDLLRPGDVLVRNNSLVVPARLRGAREETGGAWEGLFLRETVPGRWEILAKTRGRPRVGERVRVGLGLGLRLVERLGDGRWLAEPEANGPATSLLQLHGEVPLPPYIRRGRAEPRDLLRYQTVHAVAPGSVAAPTAGLHFTAELWSRLASRGIEAADITLHVGVGTFRPIEVEQIEEHQLHAEWAELTPEVAERLQVCRGRGGRIVAVGTTAARTLETAALAPGSTAGFSGETSLYIKPGHAFRGLDALLTNFHLPRSSLLVLVAALIGRDFLMEAYREAIRERYRFYSYGDAMLIL